MTVGFAQKYGSRPSYGIPTLLTDYTATMYVIRETAILSVLEVCTMQRIYGLQKQQFVHSNHGSIIPATQASTWHMGQIQPSTRNTNITPIYGAS